MKAGPKGVYPTDQLGGFDPWPTANEDDKDRAALVAWHYRESPSRTASDLADVLGCRVHEVRTARWLAVWRGWLRRSGTGFRLQKEAA